MICQYGSEECYLNKLASCAIHYLNDPFPFIVCLEKLIYKKIHTHEAIQTCFKVINTIPQKYDQIT